MNIRDITGKEIKPGDEIMVSYKKRDVDNLFIVFENEKKELVFRNKYIKVTDHSELFFVKGDDMKTFLIINEVKR